MLDFAWSELLVVVVVAVLVIGPKDIPKVMQGLGRIMRRVQYLKFALSQQFEDLMREHDLNELRAMTQDVSKVLPDLDEAAADEDYIAHEGPGQEKSGQEKSGQEKSGQEKSVQENDPENTEVQDDKEDSESFIRH